LKTGQPDETAIRADPEKLLLEHRLSERLVQCREDDFARDRKIPGSLKAMPFNENLLAANSTNEATSDVF
jgi:hypothetical protein